MENSPQNIRLIYRGYFYSAVVCIVLPAIFVGIAIIQFTLACVVFTTLIYFIIRDYVALRHGLRLHVGHGA